ncbi:MAG TPA: L-serine ammonia-lyase, iron-sulfur-dependent, subunit alpha, partial [Mobilitalea sp.]|nr:L-serine ammonia-lyase, iron-sulfur-dependent, subunit alpha [Mobilitalea sp.]
MSFKSLDEIVQNSKNSGKEFWRVVLEDDMNERMVTSLESRTKMESLYLSMKQADEDYDAGLKSASKLVGGDGDKISKALEEGRLISGPFYGEVIAKAIKMGESNACMKKIVAAPTAGSCGVIPAIFLSYEEQMHVSMDKMIEAMYVASGIGEIIAVRAFVAGAA